MNRRTNAKVVYVFNCISSYLLFLIVPIAIALPMIQAYNAMYGAMLGTGYLFGFIMALAWGYACSCHEAEYKSELRRKQ